MKDLGEKVDDQLPFFSLSSILIATDRFSEANKLGQGGFGPVYKVNFSLRANISIYLFVSYNLFY